MKKPWFLGMLCSLLLLVVSCTSVAQTDKVQGEEIAPILYRREPYSLDISLQENSGAEDGGVFRQVIQFPGAPWLQLHFSDYFLGKHSYITIISVLDDGQQRLDAQSLGQWNNATAYFNGDTVEVELHAAPGETGIFFQIDEVIVGEQYSDVKGSSSQTSTLSEESQCGTADNRVASTDPAVGRIMPVGCTGWLVSNGGVLTAGHCIGAGTQLLQFNVPPSQADGTPVNPPPEDQYPIEPVSNIDWFNDGDGAIGNDWAVFETFANSNTGLRAVLVQGAFYRMSRDINPSNVRVTGYGVDFLPPGSTGNLNADSQTEQTHSGVYLGETVQGASDVFIEYTVDTEGGNSGSPVIDTANGLTVGIHTNGGCNPPSQGNTGTGFEHNNLENAIQTFPGPNVEYVDRGHPLIAEDGSVFRPWDTLLRGVNGASSGGILSIVRGSYGETLTVGADDKALLFDAPVGTVTIGNTLSRNK
ncbi:MAG: trypsin-like peptidase domain-containing protein [Anaerolineae bacterium]|nr:trypsin-like peptidase domain-containing protein [Anaerolineae bacterium]